MLAQTSSRLPKAQRVFPAGETFPSTENATLDSLSWTSRGLERDIRPEKIRVPRNEAENEGEQDRKDRYRSSERAAAPEPGEPRLEFGHGDVRRPAHHAQLMHVLLLHEQVAQRIGRLRRRPNAQPSRRTQTEYEQPGRDAVDASGIQARAPLPGATTGHNGFPRAPPVAVHAAGGSAGFSGCGPPATGVPAGGGTDARTGRRRELSFRNGDAKTAPTRLRLAAGLAAAGEEEGLLAMGA